MAIVEHLAERVSLKSAAGYLGVAWVVWAVIGRVNERRRIKALGSYTVEIPSWAPLGQFKLVSLFPTYGGGGESSDTDVGNKQAWIWYGVSSTQSRLTMSTTTGSKHST